MEGGKQRGGSEGGVARAREGKYRDTAFEKSSWVRD